MEGDYYNNMNKEELVAALLNDEGLTAQEIYDLALAAQEKEQTRFEVKLMRDNVLEAFKAYVNKIDEKIINTTFYNDILNSLEEDLITIEKIIEQNVKIAQKEATLNKSKTEKNPDEVIEKFLRSLGC